MRQAVIIIGMIVIIFMTSLCVISINSKMTRKDELEMAVAAAVQQTVKHSEPSGKNIYGDNENMMAAFVKNLSLNLNSASDITVEFHGVDYKLGLLSVTVTESFKYPTGKMDEIQVRKTAIYD